MKQTVLRWSGRSMAVGMAALTSACAGDAPSAPYGATTAAPRVAAVASASAVNQRVDLPAGCEDLAAPVGSPLVLRAFGIGVQIYSWDGTTWQFVAPSATLYADAGGRGVVATHFGGPTWVSRSGGSVVGTVADRCTPGAASIPWLSLSATADGPGVFEKVKLIQRLNTVGGNAPSTPGTVIGQEVKVPYTADYLFYQAP